MFGLHTSRRKQGIEERINPKDSVHHFSRQFFIMKRPNVLPFFCERAQKKMLNVFHEFLNQGAPIEKDEAAHMNNIQALQLL